MRISDWSSDVCSSDLDVVEVDAHGIVSVVALRTVDLARQGDAGMRNGVERVHGLDRVTDQVVDGHVLVGDSVDEAGVGAVLEQAPDQVGDRKSTRPNSSH